MKKLNNKESGEGYMEINLDTIKFSEKSQIKILDLIWFLIIPIININYIILKYLHLKIYDYHDIFEK